jgi:protocatechuate 3,4-dioxygenase beta subunit
MKSHRGDISWVRRHLLLGALASVAQPVLAGSLVPTPAQTEGPFYPDRLPLDQDNDLTRVAGHHGSARGEIADLRGRILDTRGQPLRNVVIEIWQVDHHGHYLHTADAGAANDAAFQGSAASRLARTAPIASGPSSPCPIPAARRISM